MGKKYGVLIGLAALLVVAIFVNIRINRAQKTAAPAATAKISTAKEDDTGEYFEVFRSNRESKRDKELEVLETIIQNKDTDAETLTEAQQQKLALVDSMEKELVVESLLMAKGFEDVAVTVSESSVNVIIQAEKLTDKQVAQVLDIACRETGMAAKNVKISPYLAN